MPQQLGELTERIGRGEDAGEFSVVRHQGRADTQLSHLRNHTIEPLGVLDDVNVLAARVADDELIDDAFSRGNALGGSNVPLADLLADVARLVGRSPPRVRLPRRLMFPVAIAAEALARFTDREPLITVDGLRMARLRMFYTSARAERELGYRARPYQDGLRDAIEWFRAARYID